MLDADRPPLRIGVDGFNMSMPHGTGVATYGRVLCRTLRDMGVKVDVLFGLDVGARHNKLLREALFFDRFESGYQRPAPKMASVRWMRETASAALGAEASTVEVTGDVILSTLSERLPDYDRLLNVPGLFARAERYFKLTKRFMTIRIPDPPDVMHWTYPLPIRVAGAKNVYTLHDMVPLRLPFTTLDDKRAYLRLVKGCVRWGDQICTVSESSRRDIASLLPGAAERTTNTYQTAYLPPPPIDPPELRNWLLQLFGLHRGQYYLFYAALEPKKNVGRLIEAFLASGVAGPLVIVGGRSWRADQELRLLSSAQAGFSQAGGLVRTMDYLPRTWLSALVSGARAVLFPSLYEGFGLPVLEAMQAGRPVLTSTQSSLPEVAGDSAMLIEPTDTAAMSAAIRQLDEDEVLRARLAGQGPDQAKKFGLAFYQRRLTDLYGSMKTAPLAERESVREGGANRLMPAVN